MFYLVVEVSGEPVVEIPWVHIARRYQLRGGPVVSLIVVDIHRNVVHLRDPREPVAFQKPTKFTRDAKDMVYHFDVSIINKCLDMVNE